MPDRARGDRGCAPLIGFMMVVAGVMGLGFAGVLAVISGGGHIAVVVGISGALSLVVGLAWSLVTASSDPRRRRAVRRDVGAALVALGGIGVVLGALGLAFGLDRGIQPFTGFGALGAGLGVVALILGLVLVKSRRSRREEWAETFK